MSTIWLVGMPGAGKSSVGLAVAERLGVGFTDTDDLIEARAGRSIADIWDNEGEAAFRTLERAVIAGLDGTGGVIACGGGAVLDPENRGGMTGTVIWLDALPETIAERLEGEAHRPILAGDLLERVTETLAVRQPIYGSVSDHRVQTDGRSIEEVADEVIELWPG